MKKLAICLFAFSVILTGCATTMHNNIDPTKQEYVLVYPLYDVRENKAIDLSNCGWNHKYPVGEQYMAANFDAMIRYATNTGIEPNATYKDLDIVYANPGSLKGLNRKGEKYILILYLKKLEYAYVSTSFETSLEGFLVNVDKGNVVWNNSAEESKWLGLVGGPVGRIFGSDACNNYYHTLFILFRTFPKLTKGSAP